MQKQRQMINICDINTYIDIIGSAIIVIDICDINTYIDIIGSAIIVIELYVLFSMWRK